MGQGYDVLTSRSIPLAVTMVCHETLRQMNYWGYDNSNGRRLIVLVWTPRGEVRRIISMRKANDREKALYASHLA